MVKVSKAGQDFRFDVPVIGPRTITAAADAGVSVIGLEAGRTLLLGRDDVMRLCRERGVTIYALPADVAEPCNPATP
jgi:DUF1009 family protein